MVWVPGEREPIRFGRQRLVLSTGHSDPATHLSANLRDHEGWTVGLVNAAFREDTELTGNCLQYLERLRSRHGPLNAYVVIGSHLEPSLRQTGLGTHLYAAAAREAAQLGGALVRHDCEPEGRSSAEARRLWEGATLQEELDVEGARVAALKRGLL